MPIPNMRLKTIFFFNGMSDPQKIGMGIITMLKSSIRLKMPEKTSRALPLPQWPAIE